MNVQLTDDRVAALLGHLRYWAQTDHEKAVVWAHGFIGELHDLVAGFPHTGPLIALVELLRSEPCPRWGCIDRAVMEARFLGQSDDMAECEVLGNEPGWRPMFWPSGVEAIDAKHGGFYGLTTISGDGGVGKSTMAITSAVHAATQGWGVLIYEAELDSPTLRKYVARAAESLGVRVADLPIRCAQIRERDTFDGFASFLVDSVSWWRRKTLVVLDSLNAAVELMGTSRDYFANLNRLSGLFGTIRRETEGYCGAIIVSETNRAGEAKGGKLPYLSDMMVSIRKGEHDALVDVSITKGRYSGVSDHEELVRDWRTGRFFPRGAEPGPYAPRPAPEGDEDLR